MLMGSQLVEQREASTVQQDPPEAPAVIGTSDRCPDQIVSRLEWLDGVRAIAATFVVLHHVWLMTIGGYPGNNGPAVSDFLVYGHFAVAVFIVVSGFSLSLAPGRCGFDLREGSANFYARRFWRIVPPYWAALLGSLVLVWLGITTSPEALPVGLKDAAIYGVLLQDALDSVTPNGTFWSIAVEVHIYVIFPLLLLLVRRSRPHVVGLLVLLGIVGLHVAQGVVPTLGMLDRFTPQFLVLFVFGMMAVAGARQPLPWGRMAAGLLSCTVLIIAWVGPELVIQNLFWFDLLVGASAATLFAWLATEPEGALGRTLALPWLRFVGSFAFSLYLVHGPILQAVERFLVVPVTDSTAGEFWLLLVLGLPLSLALAYGFFHLFERPFIRIRSLAELRRTLGSRRLRRPPRALAPADVPESGRGRDAQVSLAAQRS